MDTMKQDPLKPRVLALVAQGQVQHEAFIARLSDAERVALGEPNAWTAKDHVAHNAAWIADAARVVATAARGEIPEPSPEDTEFNPQVFAAHQYRSWDEILVDAEQANIALRAALEACSDADLGDPARFTWRKGRPLWFEAYVSGYEHPAEHYGQFYLDSGDVERASAVRKEAVETARRFIGETEPYGFMVYNLGCFYAKTGQLGLALTAIREALARVPRLREWSREDQDLALLHDQLAFQALSADTTEGTAKD